jgi:hypothetical protein
MTRETILRYLLALLFLKSGNTSAYWYALPKRAKRYRLWAADMWLRESSRRHDEYAAQWLAEDFRNTEAFRALISNAGAIAPIFEREFRLSFQRTA